MKATATISGIHVEVDGTPEECWQFFKKETGFNEILEKIGEGSRRLAELQIKASVPPWLKKFQEKNGKEPCCHPSACGVACDCKGFQLKKVCDPLARHSGNNCGADDCPIIKCYESNEGYRERMSRHR